MSKKQPQTIKVESKYLLYFLAFFNSMCSGILVFLGAFSNSESISLKTVALASVISFSVFLTQIQQFTKREQDSLEKQFNRRGFAYTRKLTSVAMILLGAFLLIEHIWTWDEVAFFDFIGHEWLGILLILGGAALVTNFSKLRLSRELGGKA